MLFLVTGGTGFIGSHFIRAALAEGHQARALRRSDGSRPRIVLEHQPVWITRGLAELDRADAAGCDALVHLAAAGVSPQEADLRTLIKTNVEDSLELWLRVARAGITRFIICGSCFEYGRAAERYDFVPPEAPLEPTSPYGESKAAASKAALAFARDKGVRLQIIRPFHVYGPGQDGSNFWPSLQRAALAGEDFEMTAGEQVRDFIAVEELARQILAVTLDGGVVPGEPRVKNLGSGAPQTLRQFAEHWWKQWGGKGRLRVGALPYRADEVMRYVPLVEDAEILKS